VEEATPSLTLIIELVGVGQTHDSKRTGSECKTPVGAVCNEPSTHREYEQLTLF
jgi:putative transposase